MSTLCLQLLCPFIYEYTKEYPFTINTETILCRHCEVFISFKGNSVYKSYESLLQKLSSSNYAYSNCKQKHML